MEQHYNYAAYNWHNLNMSTNLCKVYCIYSYVLYTVHDTEYSELRNSKRNTTLIKIIFPQVHAYYTVLKLNSTNPEAKKLN